MGIDWFCRHMDIYYLLKKNNNVFILDTTMMNKYEYKSDADKNWMQFVHFLHLLLHM